MEGASREGAGLRPTAAAGPAAPETAIPPARNASREGAGFRPTTAAGPGAPEAAMPAARQRQGLVYDKWPIRLDIDTEYQDWILVAACFLILFTLLLPCICSRLRNSCGRKFTQWVYTRLHVFLCIVVYVDLAFLMCTIGILPDWTVNEFLVTLVDFTIWLLDNGATLTKSSFILITFYLLISFRERIVLAAGLEYVNMFRWSWQDAVGLPTKRRPVEIFIWKIDGLNSSSHKVYKASDVYAECHMSHNEPMRTRVHNNAGPSCMFRESFQMNIDESAPHALLTLLIKDQGLVLTTELARLLLSTRELCGIEDQTGKRRVELDYCEECFVSLDLTPSGKIWVAVAPVEDADVPETAPLMEEDSLLPTC